MPFERHRELIREARQQLDEAERHKEPLPKRNGNYGIFGEVGAKSMGIVYEDEDLIDGYEIIREIHRGGQGVVCQARQHATNRHVALKLLPHQFAEASGSVLRFEREARAAARLDHPNVVRVYSGGTAGDLHYIAFEYVDGVSLDRLIRNRIRLPEPLIVEIALSVAQALSHAHDSDVLHRDVKPGNILISRAGEVKLTDFGLAKYQAKQQSFQTTEGRVFGTPAFMSPEQTNSARAVDVRSDLYSLGCVVYNLATGRTPFSGTNPFAVLDQHRRSRPVSIRSLNPAISKHLEDLVSRAMMKHPGARYQTAQAMIEELTRVRKILGHSEKSRSELAKSVALVDQGKVADEQPTEEQIDDRPPGLQMKLIAVFLVRPMFWFTVFLAVLIVCAILSFGLGMWFGSRTD